MIVTEHLVKRFGAFTALDGLDAQIDSGRIYGLVGPNGSGKSTLTSCLTGIIRKIPASLSLKEKRSPQPTRLKPTIRV